MKYFQFFFHLVQFTLNSLTVLCLHCCQMIHFIDYLLINYGLKDLDPTSIPASAISKLVGRTIIGQTAFLFSLGGALQRHKLRPLRRHQHNMPTMCDRLLPGRHPFSLLPLRHQNTALLGLQRLCLVDSLLHYL